MPRRNNGISNKERVGRQGTRVGESLIISKPIAFKQIKPQHGWEGRCPLNSQNFDWASKAAFLHPETADILGWISTLYRGVSFCALGVMGSVSGNHLLDDLSWIQQPKMSPIVAKRPLGRKSKVLSLSENRCFRHKAPHRTEKYPGRVQTGSLSQSCL